MKRPALLAFMLLTLSLPAWGQFTLTSGTVIDPNGAAYALGTGRAQFNGSPNSVFTATGQPVGQQTIPLTLDATGTFTNVSLADNTKISPPGSTWVFSFTSAGGGVTPQVSYTATNPVTISGTSQNVSVQASAGSKALPASGLSCAQVSGCVTNPVSSFNTRTGAVTPAGADYTCVQVTNCVANALGTAGAMPQFSSYTFYVNSGTVYARNNSTGAIDASGADTQAVVNTVMGLNPAGGGRLFFKNGVYPINALTEETATGCSSFGGSGNKLAYAFGIPANLSYAVGVQWIFEGESSTVWTGELLATTIAATGVVFNITPTAVSSVTANDVLAGFWQRPFTNCTLTTNITNNNSNDLYFHNITVRFPVNTRGNEIPFAAYFAGTVQYQNDLADFNVGYNTIATGSAPTVGSYNSIGFTTTTSGAGNWEDFRNTYAVGYNIGYDFQSEHVTGTTVTAIYSNIACEFGRSAGAVFHPSKIDNFIDQENAAGCIWGNQIQQGTFYDIYFDFEFGGGDSNWYTTARANTAKLSEVNNGYATGILRYQAVSANTGVTAEIPASTLFTSGGVNFQAFEATNPPSIALTPISDTFTRPNTSPTANTNGLGPMWANGTQGGNLNLKIVSNSARVASTSGVSGGYSFYLATAFNADQFSKATCSILVAAANYCEVMVRGSTNPAVQTYYTYYMGGTATQGRGIIKVVAGVSTTLASQTASAGAAGDVMELDVVGSTLWAYRNGALDTSFTNPVTDSAIASGAPGLQVINAANAGAAFTNWQGGSFPTKTGTDSIYSNPAIHPMYLSSGTPPTPTGTGACATITTQVPASTSSGSQAGSLKCTGTTGASTITLTFPAAQSAPNGYRCSADDETTVADRPNQTSYTTTTCVLTTAATAQNDVIVWNASPF